MQSSHNYQHHRADGHPVVRVRSNAYLHRLHRRLRDRLPMWVVFRPVTREYPGRWVSRMFVCRPEMKPTRFVMTHDTLDELRAMLPPDLFVFPRDASDPPEIEETWF